MAAIPPPPTFQHLRLANRVEIQGYLPKLGRGPGINHPPRDRGEHGQRLLGQLNALRPVMTQRQAARAHFALDVPAGIEIKFQSAAGFDLAFDSLDLQQSGIELLSVSIDEDHVYATCFVPDGKLDVLVRKVQAYLEQNRKNSDEPKNQTLIESIESIGLATIGVLWTDDGPVPDAGEPIWWELWIRQAGLLGQAAFNRFLFESAKLGLNVAEQWLEFPERIVVAASATRQQLQQGIDLLNLIAEIRHADHIPVMHHTPTIAEQQNLVQGILERTDIEDSGVAVSILDTGVNRAHPLLEAHIAVPHLHCAVAAWGTHDHNGHGTKMAGMAIYGDLRSAAAGTERITVPFRLESSKILPPPPDENEGSILGAITAQGAYRCEIGGGPARRVFCNAVTSTTHQEGRPTSYSSAIDQLAYNREGPDKRLFIVSAGNVPDEAQWLRYPDSNHAYGVEHPGQSWNALTVGAYTEKITLPANHDYAGWRVLAERGHLSPYSATSCSWQKWPIKPDVLFEGGNVAVNQEATQTENTPSLQLLTTDRNFAVRPLGLFGMTSAATAQAANLCGHAWSNNPDMWPETIRGLLVHWADWTPAQRQHYLEQDTSNARRVLLKACGYGVPNRAAILASTRKRVSLVAQEYIQPYMRDEEDGAYKMKELCLFHLPWPRDMFLGLGENMARLRVTLSYFIEPEPGRRGETNRYKYASCGLRFDVKRVNESPADFNKRVNRAMLAEGERVDSPDDEGWRLGDKLRRLGSIHSDVWTGTAAELASRDLIAVYPVIGWWRERHNRMRFNERTRFALIVSVDASDIELDLDIYNAIRAELEIPIQIAQ